ncbi:MAG: hypothetical protein M1812_004906 [Candelaria pacifica]|nr:MAG: hypothetical protein M1812_004906 [Candelaria pacifica]
MTENIYDRHARGEPGYNGGATTTSASPTSPSSLHNSPVDPQPLLVERPRILKSQTDQNLPLLRSASSSLSPSPSRTPRARPREDRGSFSSVKEDDCGIAQSFVVSKFSSLGLDDSSESAIRDEAESSGYTDMATAVALHPPSFCCPCGGFRGWKRIRLSGRHLSKSHSDLRSYEDDKLLKWDWDTGPELKDIATAEPKGSCTYAAGESPLEKLPAEVLDQIVPQLAADLPPNGYTPRNVDLISCLLASRTLHAATLATLYRQITIPHSLIFSKFLQHIVQHPALGTIVKRLDFSHFSSVGMGRTKQMNQDIQNVTATTLTKCLELTPRLQEFLVQEHLEDDLDERVLRKLFCDLENLRAIDLCASSSFMFRTAFSAVINAENPVLPQVLNIRRLSLHECSTLSSLTLEVLLPRLRFLTHLDVCHTQLTDKTLSSIPDTARLTHLNLSRCTRVSGEGVVDFLTTHPAVKDTLVYLNLQADVSRYRLLSQENVGALLPRLPWTLRALNLNGANISRAHMQLLLPLTKHLEELSIGYSEINIDDVNALFVPAPPADGEDISIEEAMWIPPSLHYLDLTGISAITPRAVFASSSVLLRPMTQPLEVLELGDNSNRNISGLRQQTAAGKRLGWVVRDLGRRAWYVREPPKDLKPEERDNGKRSWKMGAMWWGMRKVPVAWGEVGGLYGHYMFKK